MIGNFYIFNIIGIFITCVLNALLFALIKHAFYICFILDKVVYIFILGAININKSYF